MFNKGDGTDRVTDSGGRIVFEQGTNNDYAGATYAFSNVGNLKLTVTKGSETLNIIDFSEHPYAYTFTTRSGDTDTRIPTSDLVVPPRQGSESNPFLATVDADSFSGTGIYDWVSYAGSTSGVTIRLSGFSDATVSGGWAARDSLDYNIDNLIGSRFADTLSGDFSANTLRGGAGNDILEGRGGRDILEGGTGQDDYIFDSSDDTIRSDSDGGRLLFRADSGSSAYSVARNSNGDVIVTVGSADITIDDNGANDAYQHGSYSLHYGTSDTFAYNLYVGREVADTIAGSSGNDYISGLGGNDKLYGGNGNDEILGGNGNDLLDGGIGDNLLEGGFGDDTYRFDAGTGTDIDSREGGLVLDIDLTGNNKVIFRAPSGVTYTNDNFVFVRGTFSTTASDPFTRTIGHGVTTCYTVVRTGFGQATAQARSAIYLIDDYYFGETSSDDLPIRSTVRATIPAPTVLSSRQQPAETS